MTTPAQGHMPFVGHRTVAALWAKQDAAKRKAALRQREAMSFGFEPEEDRAA